MVALLLGPTDKIASAMTERFSTLFPPASGDSSQLAQLPPTSASGPVGAKGAFVWVGSQIAAKFETITDFEDGLISMELQPQPNDPEHELRDMNGDDADSTAQEPPSGANPWGAPQPGSPWGSKQSWAPARAAGRRRHARSISR